ncbi:MAG: aminotransferase class I/II-fold pyridoxal phosphate-dependent enzyme, partial [Acidobacteriota bacterium]|nr:aminotransferase class I/II-fold pyridoxal phosphate-dependent enzyme [Acidobacteriota bacterium]
MPSVPSRVAGISLPPFDVLNIRAANLRAEGRDVITLGQGVPGFGPPPAAIEAARRALSEPTTHLYCADAGLSSLRRILADKLGLHHQIDATVNDLIITAGGNQAFMLAALTLLEPGDEVILSSPYFVNQEMALRAIGVTPVEAGVSELRGFRTRWADIEPHLTPRTRAVVLCTPSNPTGAVIERDDLTRIVLELRRLGIIVMCDETYMHFVYGQRGSGATGATIAGHASAGAVEGWRDNVVVLGTFSKSFGMTGWRLGYLLADSGVCEQAIKIQDAMIICAPVIAQIAAEAAVRESWDYAHAYHGELIRRRQVLAQELGSIPGLHWTPADGSFFAFVRVDGCTDSLALSTAILDAVDVVTIPGATFGRSG